ncbi:MAG: hypothetical protein LBR35_00210 [Rickettsiales bacterium]|jgi:hypothetical protein|nr:hypothetical protein [Rickettsiales bacterium]
MTLNSITQSVIKAKQEFEKDDNIEKLMAEISFIINDLELHDNDTPNNLQLILKNMENIARLSTLDGVLDKPLLTDSLNQIIDIVRKI